MAAWYSASSTPACTLAPCLSSSRATSSLRGRTGQHEQQLNAQVACHRSCMLDGSTWTEGASGTCTAIIVVSLQFPMSPRRTCHASTPSAAQSCRRRARLTRAPAGTTAPASDAARSKQSRVISHEPWAWAWAGPGQSVQDHNSLPSVPRTGAVCPGLRHSAHDPRQLPRTMAVCHKPQQSATSQTLRTQ